MSSSANHGSRNHNGRRRNPNSTSANDRNRARAENKARRERELVTNESRSETQSIDLGFTRVAPGNNDLTNDIRNILGDFTKLQEKLPKTSSNSKPNDDSSSRLLGIDLARSNSISNKPRPESHSKPDNTGHTGSGSSNSYESKNTLDLLFSSFSVKHLISPISPLSSPSHVSKPTQLDIRTSPYPRVDTTTIRSPRTKPGEVQDEEISTTVQQLWISVNLARLQRISGLTEKIRNKISGMKRKRPKETSRETKKPKRSRPVKETQPPIKEEEPPVEQPVIGSLSNRQHQYQKPSPVPRSSNKQSVKPSKNPDNSTESPVKVKDADTTTITREPDSSTMMTNLYGHDKYIELRNEGIRRQNQAEEYARSGSYLNSFIDYTEAVAFFNMAAFLLEQELDQLIQRRQTEVRDKHGRKDMTDIIQQLTDKNQKIETLVISHNMELCYKMRTMHQQRMRQMKPGQLQILERLIILCFRCEAKLNILLFKTKTSQTNFEKQIKTNQHLIHQIEQQNMGDRRQSPDSPVMPQNEETTMCKEDWKAIRQHCSIANYILKAHTKWAEAEKLQTNPNHSDFFTGIPRIADVSDLKFYESSLKDLSLYQRAVVSKLRDELTS